MSDTLPQDPLLPQPSSASPDATRSEADREPWRQGYPAFTKWASSDPDFFLLRRFSATSARIALYLQDRISFLEEQLKNEDECCREAPFHEAHNGTFRHDPRPRRVQILEELSWALERYQRFVLDHMRLKARPSASAYQIKNVRQWLRNARDPIDAAEVAFLDNEDDLTPVVYIEKTPLRSFAENHQLTDLVPCLRQEGIKKRLYKPSDFEMQTTQYISECAIGQLHTCTIMVLGLGMIIGPLWWLQHLSAVEARYQKRLEVVTGFLVLSTVMFSILTTAKPFQILVGTAAYSVVLVAFTQVAPTSRPQRIEI